MQPWPGNPRVTHLLPFPLRREYRQESSVHGSPLNGAHTHQSPARRQPLNNAPPPKNKKARLWKEKENHRGSSFRSPSGSASLTQLIQADTSGWTPRTTDPMPPVRGPGGATGEEQLVLTPDSNREGPPMIIPGNGPRGGEGSKSSHKHCLRSDQRVDTAV